MEDDFKLIDLIGGASLAAMHPSKPIVAHSSGCIIVVFIMQSDTKITLVGHQYEVHALEFNPRGDLLLSIDYNKNEPNEDNGPLSRMIIWDWNNGNPLQTLRVPASTNPSMALIPSTQLPSNMKLKNYKIVFD